MIFTIICQEESIIYTEDQQEKNSLKFYIIRNFIFQCKPRQNKAHRKSAEKFFAFL